MASNQWGQQQPNYYGQPPPGVRPPGPPGQQPPAYQGAPPPGGVPGAAPQGYGYQQPGQQNGMPATGIRPPGPPQTPGAPGMRPPGQMPPQQQPGGMGPPQQMQGGIRPQAPPPGGIRPPPSTPGMRPPMMGGIPPQQQQQQRPPTMNGAPPSNIGAPRPPAAGGFGAPPTPASVAPPGPRPPMQQVGQQPPPGSFGAPRPPSAGIGAPPRPLGGMQPPQQQQQVRPMGAGPPGSMPPVQVPQSPAFGAQQQPRPGFGSMMPPPGAATPRPPGGAVPGYGGVGVPPGPPGGFQQQQPQQPGMRPMMQPPPSMGGPPQQQQQYGAPAPPQMGGSMQAPPPSMGGMHPPHMGGGMGHGMGYDASAMQATLDAFQTLSLGPAPPAAPGQPAAPGPNPATFPRPAGSPEVVQEATGPYKPYAAANCRPEFMRMTMEGAPNSQALKARWHLPYGAIVHPMAESGGPVAVANAGSATIVRCKRCRTYMNPFMQWLDGGRRFSCCICQQMNEVPVDYFCALDGSGRRIDHDQRPELSCGSAEYVAPAEYMVRAPMPPTYVFVIDVSVTAAANGMLPVICSTIKSCLDNLPGDTRTRVAFITFDSTIHFYNLRSTLSGPQMMVIAEVDDPFVPIPDDLLVNLVESRHVVDKLLDSIPQSFGRNGSADSAMGPALQTAFLIMNHVGGKLMLFQAATPSLGIGKVKARDNPAVYGTDREYTLRAPDDPFYKRFSAEASRFQICIDVFALGTTFMDLPSLGALSKYTGGQVYYYPGFMSDKDGNKLAAELHRNLTRETTWEAVMRIRCSKGLRISAFYGHFFVRSTDLLALPACDVDKAFAVEISHEETLLTGQTAYVQSALLYTSSAGERRIRVHTMAVPVLNDLLDLYKHSDAGATVALMGKWAIERGMSCKLDDVRASVQQRLSSCLREYRALHMRSGAMGGPPPTSAVLPERLRALPILTLGLLKTAALRGSGRDVNTDERATVSHMITASPAEDILRLVYPRCYPVHDPKVSTWGQPTETGTISLPSTAPAGLEYFDPSGAYIIDNGRVIVLWLGTSTPQQFYNAVFGAGGPGADTSGLRLEPAREGSELSVRINNVVRQLRAGKEVYQEVYVVRQGTPMEAHVMPYFVEDRLTASGVPGYLDFMVGLQKAVMSKQ